MNRVLSLAVLSIVTGWAAGAADAHAQTLTVAERAPRFYLASAGSKVFRDASDVPLLKRRIAVALDRVPLREAIEAISTKAKLRLVYSGDVLPERARVSLEAANITVTAALTEVLLDTGLDVVVSPTGQMTLVTRRSAPAVPAGAIVGTVKDAKTGQRVAEAEVLLEGTRWRTATDSAGRYRLGAVDSGAYTLTARRLGYKKRSQSVTVHAGRQQDTVDMALDPVAVPLDSLVATATGAQRRRDIGNSITTLKADSLMQTAVVRNLTDLLKNRVPGLTVQHTSGAPGDPARTRLRGIGSILHASDPVVIVDGMRVYAAQSAARSGNLTNLAPEHASTADVPAPSPLDQIDPNIIEKIEVFKGPSAATMYGADAANGVIVITTKRGKPGPTVWSARVQQAHTFTPGRYPIGYYRWGRDQYNGIKRFCTLVDVTCLQDSLVQFQSLNDPALTVLAHGRLTTLSLGASGGTPALTYQVTGSYSDELGSLQLPAFEVERFRTLFNRNAPDWMQRPLHYKMWSVFSTVTARLSPTAEVMLSTTISRSEQRRTSLEEQLAPLAGTYVDTVNGIYYRPTGSVGSSAYALDATANILQDYYLRRTASTMTFASNLNANWRPRPWLEVNGRAALQAIPRDDQALLPAGLRAITDSGFFSRGTGRSLTGTFELRGTARKSLGAGFMLNTVVGTNVTNTTISDLIGSASGLVPGTSSLNNARRVLATEQRSASSVFGWYLEPRITGQRLSLSTGIRIDGGSDYGARITGTNRPGNPFSPRNLFGLRSLLTLPKLNGSWVVSEEPFFPFKSLFSSLRLRGAYGQAQVQPTATDRLRLYTSSVNQLGQLLTLTTVGNTHLRPERSTEFEGGFEADMLDSRLAFDVTGYRKMQVDALMTVNLPGSVNGGGGVMTNVGNIRNTGVEVTVGLVPVRSPLLTWSMQTIFSQNRNTLVTIGRGVTPNPAAGLVEGYPVFSRWARPILGFADQNGDGVLQPNEIQVGDSLIYMGRLYPNYSLSFSTGLAVGAFHLTADFHYDAGSSQVDETARTNWVLARALVDPAVPLGQQAEVLASTRGGDPTDYGLTQTVSTLRFNSLSMSYNAPPAIARLLRAQTLSVAVKGDNLGMHTTYRGKDPDVSAWIPGERIVDRGQLPQPRTWQFAVNLQY